MAYKFDADVLLTTLVRSVVLLGLVTLITDSLVFNLPGGVGKVLSTKRSERANVQSAFAELGMKAAAAVSQFQKLDSDNTGAIGPEDLVRAPPACTARVHRPRARTCASSPAHVARARPLRTRDR